jgi:hypothetical protein
MLTYCIFFLLFVAPSLVSYTALCSTISFLLAGEIWFASSVLIGLLLFGLAVFFAFGLLPYG